MSQIIDPEIAAVHARLETEIVRVTRLVIDRSAGDWSAAAAAHLVVLVAARNELQSHEGSAMRAKEEMIFRVTDIVDRGGGRLHPDDMAFTIQWRAERKERERLEAEQIRDPKITAAARSEAR